MHALFLGLFHLFLVSRHFVPRAAVRNGHLRTPQTKAGPCRIDGHVATADEQVLPGGTAFQCDVGMTGPYDSILGREIDPVMRTTLTFRPAMNRLSILRL